MQLCTALVLLLHLVWLKRPGDSSAKLDAKVLSKQQYLSSQQDQSCRVTVKFDVTALTETLTFPQTTRQTQQHAADPPYSIHIASELPPSASPAWPTCMCGARRHTPTLSNHAGIHKCVGEVTYKRRHPSSQWRRVSSTAVAVRPKVHGHPYVRK
jgi:hypothetical protein